MEAQSTYLQSADQNKMNLTGNNSKEVLVLHDDTEAEGIKLFCLCLLIHLVFHSFRIMKIFIDATSQLL